ncbi:hypothetical protein ACH4FX_40695 [Streptomyces sp. NPDC018019]|uniref:hypothetical protein n=1 Tax=Streptomyces sp. NPDC018019 TaxID=3365030 RepID=UPI0037A2677B
MDAAVAAVALEDARFAARQDSRHEHLADDERGRAELAEWERLATAVPGTVYDPDTDDADQLAFAARLATTDPEATGALAAFFARARS